MLDKLYKKFLSISKNIEIVFNDVEHTSNQIEVYDVYKNKYESIIEDVESFFDKFILDKIYDKFKIPNYYEFVEKYMYEESGYLDKYNVAMYYYSLQNMSIEIKQQYALKKYGLKNIFNKRVNTITLENFLKFVENDIIKIDSYDAYGSGLFKMKEETQEFILFSTDDNGVEFEKKNSKKHYKIVTTLFCYNPKTFEIELGNICYNYKTCKYSLKHVQKGKLNHLYQNEDPKSFTGKRCFTWKHDEKKVVIRIKERNIRFESTLHT